MSRKKLFIANAGTTLLSRVGGNLLSFVTLPLFVTYYGDSLYGVFVLAVAVTESLALFDFGVKNALVRYTAEFLVDKDRERYNTAVAGSVLIAGALGIIFALFVLAMSFVAPTAFDIETELAAESIDVFQVAALYTLVFVVGRVAQSILEGHQMFYWNSINQISVLVVNLALFFVVKYWGLSFFAFAVFMMLGRLIPIVLNTLVILQKKLLKGVSLRQGLNWALIRSEFFRYSANLFALQLISFCAFQIDKFVIGGILSAAMVTVYIVVTKPMFIVRMVSNQTLMVLAPVLAEIGRSGDDSHLNSIIRRGNLALAVLVFPMVALVFIFIQQFIDIWIGGVHSDYAFWGAIASLSFIFSPFYGISSRALTYTGNIVVVRRISFWTTLLNVIVSLVGTFYLGIGGVILGSLVQAAIQVPIYFRVMKQERGLGPSNLIPGLFWINAGFVLAVGSGLFFLMRRVSFDNWVHFAVALLVATALLYSFGIWIVLRQNLLSRHLR
jgi:O-antigen/teichoic acid export membrane protein